MNKITFENYNHSIVYAPNSAGKTRQTNELKKKKEGSNIIVLTSKTISEMIDVGAKNIKIGIETKLIKENEEIQSEFNKQSDFSEYITNLYNLKPKSISKLKGSSFLFSEIEASKFNSFELFKFLSLEKPNVDKYVDAKTSDLIYLDTHINTKLVKDIKALLTKGIEIIINENNKVISSELKDALLLISSQINNDITSCPLCGHDFKDNKLLKENIKASLEHYITDSDAINKEKINRFLNSIATIEDNTDLTLLKEGTDREDMFSNIQNIIFNINSYQNELRSRFLDVGKEKANMFLVNRYNENNKMIKNEKSKRNNNDFLSLFSTKANELIALPDDYRFSIKNENILIVDGQGKEQSPSTFLSDSEQRRLSIVVAFSEIQTRNIEYIIFDDPADTNDDYYFDTTVNAIINYLEKWNTLNWIIFTHEIRFVSLFAAEVNKYDPNSINPLGDLKFIFYLPDPNFNGSKRPSFNMKILPSKYLTILNNHEVMIFKDIFTNTDPMYECDKEMALLASFNQARCLYDELLKEHKVSDKNKLLKNKLKKVCGSYEHYVFNPKRRVKFLDLYYMNKHCYNNGKYDESLYSTTSQAKAVNVRKRFLKRDFTKISCNNFLIKFILYTMIRVYDSHYEYERKLGEWANRKFNGGTSFSQSDFEKKRGIWERIKYVSLYALSTKNKLEMDTFIKTYNKWSILLNDFSHGAARMIPPYLSVSPLEVTKMENEIKRLP